MYDIVYGRVYNFDLAKKVGSRIGLGHSFTHKISSISRLKAKNKEWFSTSVE